MYLSPKMLPAICLGISSLFFFGPVRHPGNDFLPVNDKNEAFAAYFRSCLEPGQWHEPGKAFYTRFIAPGSIAAKKQEAWLAWQEANKQRMTTLPDIAPGTTKDSLLWTLPQENKMLFALRKKGDMPANGYPFFINLHGGGQHPEAAGPWAGDVNSAEWEAAKKLAGMYKDAPSYYFVPRMADDRKGRWNTQPNQAAYLRAWQLAVLSGSVNPDQTFIMGISEGGYGSFRMGAFFADYFAGLGPLAGPETQEAVPIENLRNVATRTEVGQNDRMFGRDTLGRMWKRRLDSAAKASPGQFTHEVVIQEGRGHGIDYFNVTRWLSRYSRSVYPDTLGFRFYPQDGAYRNGFGYVRLTGLSKTGQRNFLIIKKGNTYNISSQNVENKVDGVIELYLDRIDFKLPVQIYLEGKKVFSQKVKPNEGVLAESIALFGDPGRMFLAKAAVNL